MSCCQYNIRTFTNWNMTLPYITSSVEIVDNNETKSTGWFHIFIFVVLKGVWDEGGSWVWLRQCILKTYASYFCMLFHNKLHFMQTYYDFAYQSFIVYARISYFCIYNKYSGGLPNIREHLPPANCFPQVPPVIYFVDCDFITTVWGSVLH